MWHPEPYGGPGFWAVTRHADIMAVKADPQTFSSRKGGILMAHGDPQKRHALLYRASMDTMINLDGAEHIQLRREHMPYFTPAYLRGVTEAVRAEVSRLLDEMAPLGAGRPGRALLVQAAAVHPVRDPGRAGRGSRQVPEVDALSGAAQDLAVKQALAPITPTLELMQFVQDFNTNVEEMFEYGRDDAAQAPEEPQNDLMSAIARAQVDGTLLATSTWTARGC
jgi:cytochrome P450